MKSNTEMQAETMDNLLWEQIVKPAEIVVSATARSVTLESAVNQKFVSKDAVGALHYSEFSRNLIAHVTRNVQSEIHSMRGVLGAFANTIDFVNLEQSVTASLARIECLIAERKIEPLVKVRHSVGSAPVPREARELRIGIFPTAADPFHWAHILGGLIVMEKFSLDKVIFVIAGGDSRKPDMAPEGARHAMAKEVLELFHPLFEYCSIALGTTASGEENLFKILGMNPTQAIHAFYIAGGDHYHRIHPGTGRPDTIQKLEEGKTAKLHGFDEHLHHLSAVFLHREDEEADIPTFLDVLSVGKLPVQTSSTEIRMALIDQSCWRKLYALPFVELDSIHSNGLYHTGVRGANPKCLSGSGR
jgi:nicotinic acid mononucleotide adenylyltransferase